MTYTSLPARSAASANLLCLLSMLTWAAGLPALGYLVAYVPPITLTAWRVGLAGIVLVVIWAALEGPRTVLSARWGRGIGVGFLVMGLGAILLVIALKRTDPVTAAIITSLMPVIGLGLEVVLDSRRITLPLAVGLILSLLGGFLAIDLTQASLSFGIGALCALASVFAFTLGSRMTVTSFPDMTALGRTALTVGGAGIALAVLAAGYSALGGPAVQWDALGPWDYAAVVGASVGSIALSQTLWIVSVAALGIGIASLHMNAVPFYVMLMTFALGGAWDWRQAAGAAVVVAGVMVAQGMIRLPVQRA